MRLPQYQEAARSPLAKLKGGSKAMSHVTNVVVHVEYAPIQVHEALVSPLPFDRHGASLKPVSPYFVGGTKVMETDLYAAAFNYLELGEFFVWFLKLPWDEECDAVLSLYDQDGDAYIIRVDGMEAQELKWTAK